jgi:hypothetical protein
MRTSSRPTPSNTGGVIAETEDALAADMQCKMPPRRVDRCIAKGKVAPIPAIRKASIHSRRPRLEIT